MREVRTGEIYRHFKGNLYQIVTVARHSETNEKYVVYQALYGDMQTWIRPYDMFVGEVDHDKYPSVSQKYRFELVNTLAGSMPAPSVSSSECKPENKPESEPENRAECKSEPEPENRVECKSGPEPENKPECTAEPEPEDGSEGVDERLLAFLDAETCQDKINYLTLIRNSIDDRLINDIAAAMDITVEEGPLDTRYFSLKNCLMTKAKYECARR